MMRKFVVFLATICILFAPAIAETPNKTAHRADYAVVSADTNTSRAATTRGASVTNRSSDTLNRAGAPRNDKGRTITTRSESSNTRATSATRGTTSRTARTNNVVNRTSAASNATTRTNASTARTATASRVSRTATTTAPQTARTRAATNTVQNAARARTAISTNMTRHAASATNAAKTGTRRARTTSSLNANATITDTCREQYTQCMDNFCNVLDDNQGRCSCSKNIKNYAKTEEALKLATESLQDVAQQIQYIGLTTDEIETLFTQTEAEIAMQSSTDNSQIKNDLDKIRGLIVDVKTGTASSTETGLSFDLSGLLDFSIDSTGFDLGSLFGNNQTNTSSISNQRGEQLYKTAAARCKKSVLDSCAKNGANTTLIANTYDMEIDRACVAYERSLTDQNDEMVRTVRNANTVLQKARLMVAQQKNTYDLRGCLNALDSCMQDDFVCGTDYELCLDPTGKYIVDGAIVTGSTPGFVMTDAITDPMPAEYSRGTLMGSWTYNNDAKFAWAAENEDGTLAEYIANTVSTTPVTSTSTNLSEFLQHKIGYIDNRNKPQGMCGTVLTKCQAITMDKDGKYNPSNRLITEYLTRTLTQIKLAQDKILSAHASACIADVESCLNTNNYSGTNTSAANIAINACRAQIKTCMSVNGNTSANPTPEVMKNWIAVMMTDEAQNLCLLTGGTWDSDSNDCSCPSGYLPDDNGTCKTTTAINPYNPSNNPTTQTTMVLKKSVKNTDGSASAIVRDTDTGILFTTVVTADGTTDDSVDGACVISSTSTAVNENTCAEDNTVTLLNGAGAATFAMRRALTDPEETVSFTFNGEPVSYLNLALENGNLPSDVSWVLNLSTANYVFAGITDESGTPYYDKNAKRIKQTPPANSELHITFEYFSNAHLACISNNYGTWDSDTNECNCTSDTYRLDESTGVCEPIDTRELNCTNSGGVWTNDECDCSNKFGTIVKNNKCVCDKTNKHTIGTPTKTSECECESGYKETDDGTACEWDYTESINACTNSGGTWNDTDHICDCSDKFGAKADGYKCVCDTSKNVAENNELTTDTECTCIDWYKQDTANNMCVTDETAIGCRDTAGTWAPDSRTCACDKDNMSVDPTDNDKCACNTGWTLNSDKTACIVDDAYTKCTDSGGKWNNGTCNCDNKFGTIESDGVCICDTAKNTTGNPTRDQDCACATGYYKESETSTQCTFDTAAKNCTGSGGDWDTTARTCSCAKDNMSAGETENTCQCDPKYKLNGAKDGCIEDTQAAACLDSGGEWTGTACTNCQIGATVVGNTCVCDTESGYTGTAPNCTLGIEYPFTFTVSNTASVAFNISAAGTFLVDWGDGTTRTIEKETGEQRITHSFADKDTHTVKLGGLATGYADDKPAISFQGNTNLTAISGSLGAIFKTLNNGPKPDFQRTFQDCTALTSVPAGLFSGTTSTTDMFYSTFQNCTALTKIPADLFSGITGAPAERMFYNTFDGCTGLTEIPAGLFSGITGAPAEFMFYGTFHNCKSLTTIRENLFSGIKGAPAKNMFEHTFSYTALTEIPENLFSGISGAPAERMFFYTFSDSDLTKIPEGLFSGITGTPANQAFEGTFVRCTALTEIPEDLFSGINGAPAEEMYMHTFYGCNNLNGTINGATFGNFTGAPANKMFYYTFYNTPIASTADQIITDITKCLQTSGSWTNGTCDCPSGGSFTSRGCSTSGGTNNCTGGQVWTGNECTCPDGQHWDNLNSQCTANIEDVEIPYPFEFTVSGNASSSAVFKISAAGTFLVDWGDGEKQTIEKEEAGEETIDHIFADRFSEDTHTVKLGGLATGYADDKPAISFQDNKNLTAISGSLGTIFKTLSDGSQPKFQSTFEGCTELTTIQTQTGLFGGITGAPAESMFNRTFMDCTSLTSIPANLFSGITGAPAKDMFNQTFDNCVGLTEIPEGLFSGITGAPAEFMFKSTFANCKSLTTIRENLFSGIKGAPAESMFSGTFSFANLTSIPAGLFSGITGAPAPMMFDATFASNKNLTSIPAGLFSGISGKPADHMFYRTFMGCDKLNGPIDGTTFGNFTGAKVDDNMFYNAFTSTLISNEAYQITTDITLCLNQSGSWTNGACACPDGGKFTSGVGCAASSNTHTCTGGQVWTGNECKCPDGQDWDSENNKCTADTEIPDLDQFEFTVTISDITRVAFKISAAGTFYVNWGDGSDTEIITRSDLGQTSYKHDYPEGTYKIKISGVPTKYSPLFPAISFDGNMTITNINDKLGRVFHTLSDGSNPRFDSTFSGQQNLTWIPVDLFSGISGVPAESMFARTFAETGLTSIPNNLFNNLELTSLSDGLFNGTFAKTNVSYIPADLFAFAQGMTLNSYTYQYTFQGCTSLTSIPAGLFRGISNNGYHTFAHAFDGCTRLTKIDKNPFSNISGTPSHSMFYGTFSGCTNLTSVMGGMFTGISGEPVSSMFSDTFAETGLTSVPENLFQLGNGTSVGLADSTFARTFMGCSALTSIPAGLFAQYTDTNEGAFFSTFKDCTSLTSIQPNLFSSIVGRPLHQTFDTTFANCTSLTSIPANLFSGISGQPTSYAFHETFANCTNVTGQIPTKLFGDISGTPATSMFQGMFANTKLSGTVSNTFFGSFSGAPATDMFTDTFANTNVTDTVTTTITTCLDNSGAWKNGNCSCLNGGVWNGETCTASAAYTDCTDSDGTWNSTTNTCKCPSGKTLIDTKCLDPEGACYAVGGTNYTCTRQDAETGECLNPTCTCPADLPTWTGMQCLAPAEYCEFTGGTWTTATPSFIATKGDKINETIKMEPYCACPQSQGLIPLGYSSYSPNVQLCAAYGNGKGVCFFPEDYSGTHCGCNASFPNNAYNETTKTCECKGDHISPKTTNTTTGTLKQCTCNEGYGWNNTTKQCEACIKLSELSTCTLISTAKKYCEGTYSAGTWNDNTNTCKCPDGSHLGTDFKCVKTSACTNTGGTLQTYTYGNNTFGKCDCSALDNGTNNGSNECQCIDGYIIDTDADGNKVCISRQTNCESTGGQWDEDDSKCDCSAIDSNGDSILDISWLNSDGTCSTITFDEWCTDDEFNQYRVLQFENNQCHITISNTNAHAMLWRISSKDLAAANTTAKDYCAAHGGEFIEQPTGNYATGTYGTTWQHQYNNLNACACSGDSSYYDIESEITEYTLAELDGNNCACKPTFKRAGVLAATGDERAANAIDAGTILPHQCTCPTGTTKLTSSPIIDYTTLNSTLEELNANIGKMFSGFPVLWYGKTKDTQLATFDCILKGSGMLGTQYGSFQCFHTCVPDTKYEAVCEETGGEWTDSGTRQGCSCDAEKNLVLKSNQGLPMCTCDSKRMFSNADIPGTCTCPKDFQLTETKDGPPMCAPIGSTCKLENGAYICGCDVNNNFHTYTVTDGFEYEESDGIEYIYSNYSHIASTKAIVFPNVCKATGGTWAKNSGSGQETCTCPNGTVNEITSTSTTDDVKCPGVTLSPNQENCITDGGTWDGTTCACPSGTVWRTNISHYGETPHGECVQPTYAFSCACYGTRETDDDTGLVYCRRDYEENATHRDTCESTGGTYTVVGSSTEFYECYCDANAGKYTTADYKCACDDAKGLKDDGNGNCVCKNGYSPIEGPVYNVDGEKWDSITACYPKTDDSQYELLCKNSGGTWSNGACSCTADGLTHATVAIDECITDPSKPECQTCILDAALTCNTNPGTGAADSKWVCKTSSSNIPPCQYYNYVGKCSTTSCIVADSASIVVPDSNGNRYTGKNFCWSI